MDTIDNSEKKLHETKPAGYRVESVLLLESNFKRTTDTEISNSDRISNEIEVLPTAHETTLEGRFAVTLYIKYHGLQNGVQICSAEIKMIGVFEKHGEPSLSDDKFKSMNAPAIIYPFIREHLHNLCLKAGIANVLLPTVNFKP